MTEGNAGSDYKVASTRVANEEARNSQRGADIGHVARISGHAPEINPCRNNIENGQRHAYWALVESVRTARGPRQRVVSYLGDLDDLGVREAARSPAGAVADPSPLPFADSAPIPQFVKIDTSQVRVENVRSFGGPWLAMQLIDKLGTRWKRSSRSWKSVTARVSVSGSWTEE